MSGPLSRITGEDGHTGTDAPNAQPGSFAQSMSVDSSQSDGEAPQKNRLSGVGAIAAVLVVSAGALLVMRHFGMRGMVDMPDIEIDYPLEQAEARVLNADHEEVIDELRTSGQLVQVPLDALQMNPFTWKGMTTDVPDAAPVVSGGPSAEEIRRREREALRQKVAAAHSKLKLNSILGGPKPMASISGELVGPGDRVGEYFVVHAIYGRQVELMAEGEIYTLALGE